MRLVVHYNYSVDYVEVLINATDNNVIFHMMLHRKNAQLS